MAKILTFMCLFNHQWAIYTDILKPVDKGWCEPYSLPGSGANRDCRPRRRNHPFENQGTGSSSRPDRLPGEPLEAPDTGNLALPGSVRATRERRDVSAVAGARHHGDGISATRGSNGRRAGRFFTRGDAGWL